MRLQQLQVHNSKPILRLCQRQRWLPLSKQRPLLRRVWELPRPPLTLPESPSTCQPYYTSPPPSPQSTHSPNSHYCRYELAQVKVMQTFFLTIFQKLTANKEMLTASELNFFDPKTKIQKLAALELNCFDPKTELLGSKLDVSELLFRRKSDNVP